MVETIPFSWTMCGLQRHRRHGRLNFWLEYCATYGSSDPDRYIRREVLMPEPILVFTCHCGENAEFANRPGMRGGGLFHLRKVSYFSAIYNLGGIAISKMLPVTGESTNGRGTEFTMAATTFCVVPNGRSGLTSERSIVKSCREV
jgi:hypothetical protein